MRRGIVAPAFFAVIVGIVHISMGNAFTPGDLVVYRVGTGTGNLVNTGNVVFLDEYTASGTLVQSIALPTTNNGANKSLIASGTATSEGFLTRSTDGRFILLTGYNATPGGGTNLANAASATIPRTVGRVDASGAIDTTTALTDFADGNNPRTAASTDGVNLWIGGAGTGTSFTTLGSTTSTQLNATGIRQLNIFGGQLYGSTNSGSTFRVGTVGTGLPTTGGQTLSNLPGLPTSSGSPYGFFLADLDAGVAGFDTAYVADDNGAGTIIKYSLVGGTWTSNGTIAAGNVRGLTAGVNGSTVSLFASTGAGSSGGGGTLYSFTDSTGYNGALVGATATTIATASANTVFRGIAFAPVPEPATAALLAPLGVALLFRRKRWTK